MGDRNIYSITAEMEELQEKMNDLAIAKKVIEETSDEIVDYAYVQQDFDDVWQGFGTVDY